MPLAMKASNIGDFRESFLALVLHLLKTDVATDPSLVQREFSLQGRKRH